MQPRTSTGQQRHPVTRIVVIGLVAMAGCRSPESAGPADAPTTRQTSPTSTPTPAAAEEDLEREPYPVASVRVQLDPNRPAAAQLLTTGAVSGRDEEGDPDWVQAQVYIREDPPLRTYLAINSTMVELPWFYADWNQRIGLVVVDLDPADDRQEILVRRRKDLDDDDESEAIELYLQGSAGLEHHRLWDGGTVRVETPGEGGLQIIVTDCDRTRSIRFVRKGHDVVRVHDETTPRPDAGNCSD